MEGFNFLSFLEAAYKRKWYFVVPVVLCTAAAAVVAVLLPSHYKSSTMILVEQQQVPASYVTPTDTTPFNQKLNTIRQQILSRPNLEKIIENFDLYSAGSGKKSAKEDALAQLVSNIEIRLVGERRAEDAFSISFSGTDPYTTMQVTSTLGSMFIEENLKRREQYAEGTTGFLSDELDQAKSELEKQEQAVRAFKERYMGGLPQQLEANLRTLDRLQLELQSVKLEMKGTEDRKALLEAQLSQAGALPAAPGAPANPLVAELESRQRELAGLLSEYNENYPDVVITRRRIEELRQLLTSPSPGAQPSQSNAAISAQIRNPEAYNNLLAVESQMKSLKMREADIRRQINLLERRVDDTPANEQRFADLNRDYQISLNNYQSLLEKRLNARLAENLEKRQKGERFRIIDPANLPERPYKPNRPMVVSAGAGIGAGIGFGLVFLLEFINPAFKKPEDFEGVFEMELLATVPAFNSLPDESQRKESFFKKVTKGKWVS